LEEIEIKRKFQKKSLKEKEERKKEEFDSKEQKNVDIRILDDQIPPECYPKRTKHDPGLTNFLYDDLTVDGSKRIFNETC